MFAGERDEIRYAAALPPRVQEGGAYFFRLAVVQRGDKSQLVLERTIPDPAATQNPEFTAAEHSVLADGIAELRVSYFGRDANANDVDLPSWRDRWDDRQRLPLLMRIDVKPVQRPGVADARRRAAARARIRVRVVRSVAQPLRGGGLMRALRPSPAARQQRHRPDRRLVAHDPADRHRQRIRVQHARRSGRRAQRALARAGAGGGGRRRRADGVRAHAPAQPARRVAGRRLGADMVRRRDQADDLGASTKRRASTSTPRAIRC